MLIKADKWIDYACLDAGNGEKIERWGNYLLRRPDPSAIWPLEKENYKVDAIYHRSHSGGGHWEYKKALPEYWEISYKNLRFKVSPTNFKHTGLFPEQAANWDWISDLIQQYSHKDLRILNLFAYTGAATMAAAKAGAKEVVHVDASKGIVEWAKENRNLCGLENHTIRFLVDDALKFVQREKRRNRTYHGILLDPPSYGRGPNGEMWKFEKDILALLEACVEILDEDALFFLMSGYTTGFSTTSMENLLKTVLPEGKLEVADLAIPIESRDLNLPCGTVGRWVKK